MAESPLRARHSSSFGVTGVYVAGIICFSPTVTTTAVKSVCLPCTKLGPGLLMAPLTWPALQSPAEVLPFLPSHGCSNEQSSSIIDPSHITTQWNPDLVDPKINILPYFAVGQYQSLHFFT